MMYFKMDRRSADEQGGNRCEDDKTFSFSYDVLSSYLNHDTYAEDDGQLVLNTDDGKYQYTFEIIEDYTLRFDKKNHRKSN